MKPLLVFDYDGTIHETLKIYEPAMRKVFQWLEDRKYAEIGAVPQKKIASWLGMNSRDMWNSFQPGLAEERKEEASARVGKDMVHAVRNHQASWYPGIREALDTFKNLGFQMIVLSNCKYEYARAHWEEFEMERWFSGFYDCESFGFAPKQNILKEILGKTPVPCLVVGDRNSDLECARAVGGGFVGCLYGYGGEQELSGADVWVKRPEELKAAVLKAAEHIR